MENTGSPLTLDVPRDCCWGGGHNPSGLPVLKISEHHPLASQAKSMPGTGAARQWASSLREGSDHTMGFCWLSPAAVTGATRHRHHPTFTHIHKPHSWRPHTGKASTGP